MTAPTTSVWTKNGTSMTSLEELINKREHPAASELHINLRAEKVGGSDSMQYWQCCPKPATFLTSMKGKLVCSTQKELRGQHTITDRIFTVLTVCLSH